MITFQYDFRGDNSSFPQYIIDILHKLYKEYHEIIYECIIPLMEHILLTI